MRTAHRKKQLVFYPYTYMKASDWEAIQAKDSSIDTLATTMVDVMHGCGCRYACEISRKWCAATALAARGTSTVVEGKELFDNIRDVNIRMRASRKDEELTLKNFSQNVSEVMRMCPHVFKEGDEPVEPPIDVQLIKDAVPQLYDGSQEQRAAKEGHEHPDRQ